MSAMSMAACGSSTPESSIPEPGSPEASQAQRELAAAVQPACLQQPLPDAAALEVGGSPASIIEVLMGADYTSAYIPDAWRASRLSEAQLVACVAETRTVIETCLYSGGFTLSRYEVRVTVQLRVARTGQLFTDRMVFFGGTPDQCPAEVIGGNTGSADFAKQPYLEIEQWLEEVLPLDQ